MPGIYQRPVGAGLGVCHDPNKWQAYIPGGAEGNQLQITDTPGNTAWVEMLLPGSYYIPMEFNKALLCDLAWAILKQYEVPHIQEDLQKLQHKAGW